MRVNWNYIKMLVLLGLTVFLFAFSSQRNARRNVQAAVIQFEDESSPFVTRETVNKLLIQNKDSVTGTVKENLALDIMEARVKAHPIVKNADVYVTVSGQLGVSVKQRKPIARLNGATSFYIDESGEVMPLSENFAAHVPLVSGVGKEQMSAVFDLATFLKVDSFLEEHIVGVMRKKSGDYVLTARMLGYKIVLGEVDQLESKFNNYKAFYQKAVKDKTLNNYKTINLKYKNQVVCEQK